MAVKPFLKKAFLYPTMLCNLRCKMCYSAATQDIKIKEGELSFLEYQKNIKKLYDYGVRFFDISGGEPLLSHNLIPILKEIKKYDGTTIYMVSNGTLINKYKEKIQEAVNYTDRIYISFDSANEEEHNKIRGSSEAFSSAVEGLDKLQRTGFKNIGINFLIMHDNKEQIMPILNFAVSKNVKYINLLRLIDVAGNAETYEQHLKIETFTNIYNNIQRWVDCRNSKSEVVDLSEINLVLPAYCFKSLMACRKRSAVSDKIKLNLEFDPFQGCIAFSDSVIVKSDGRITGCTAMANCSCFHISDNFGDDELFFKEWKRMKDKIILREESLKNKEPCKSCEYLRICKGGCPAVAQKYIGDFMKIDPTCVKITAESN